jgi:hypothetical protein
MTKRDRIIISVLIVWTFIHTYFLLANYIDSSKDRYGRFVTIQKEWFYPFTVNYSYNPANYFDLWYYDYSEYFVYVVGAWGGLFLYKFLKGSQ